MTEPVPPERFRCSVAALERGTVQERIAATWAARRARLAARKDPLTGPGVTVLAGPTQYIGKPSYQQAHGPSPIKLQAHGDPSAPISFRNIWVRPLPEGERP